MTKFFEEIGFAITSMAAVIFVLLLTLLGLLMFTHTLFYEVLPSTITGWERYTASWLLALGWEFTLLISTVNTQFLNRKIPIIAAIASGVIVLFFIEAFEFNQPPIEIFKKWFIGILVATVNFIYTELFYAKWSRLQKQRDLEGRIFELESQAQDKDKTIFSINQQLQKTQTDVERLIDYSSELETFKKREIEKVTCNFCKHVFKTIYHLHSHRANCKMNPKKGERFGV